ncbi:acyltransferase [Amycolatopsis rhabdoformis]|uniref:Acyltransferase n=1 Tax=Amycolatopsis rhabdoformis TaxID=1448059 RepID=A0ABZ1IA68_9PSEU|nr:acyltransferase [Amycolatopsis rhabdoformis]WSE30454.1 acyltransferase [Amycolatopsis rhabdoformis]
MTHETYLATRRFPALDGVRAIAAVLVVLFHFGGAAWVRANGWIGVHVFFVLSGFLITTLALREEDRSGRVSLKNFYLRRAFRILPVYYVVLGIFVVVEFGRGELRSSGLLGALPWFATFLNEFHVVGVFGVAWTLGVEQKFYLVWPLLAFGIAGLGLAKRFGLALGLVIALVALVPVLPYSGAYASIVIGCAVAIALHHRKSFAVLKPFTHPVAGIVVAAMIVVVQVFFSDITAAIHDDGGVALGTTYAVLVALLLPSLVAGGPLSRVLALKPLRFIGERSYSLYLIQSIAGWTLAGLVPPLGQPRTLTALGVTAVALLMADLLYRWVELPMIGLGRRVTAKKPEPAEEAREPVPA